MFYCKLNQAGEQTVVGDLRRINSYVTSPYLRGNITYSVAPDFDLCSVSWFHLILSKLSQYVIDRYHTAHE